LAARDGAATSTSISGAPLGPTPAGGWAASGRGIFRGKGRGRAASRARWARPPWERPRLAAVQTPAGRGRGSDGRVTSWSRPLWPGMGSLCCTPKVWLQGRPRPRQPESDGRVTPWPPNRLRAASPQVLRPGNRWRALREAQVPEPGPAAASRLPRRPRLATGAPCRVRDRCVTLGTEGDDGVQRTGCQVDCRDEVGLVSTPSTYIT
jgi:hypothetical protein